MPEDLLHYACGMHRGSAPNANGHTGTRFEDAARRHYEAGSCPRHESALAITAGGQSDCSACGQAAEYHGTP